MQIRKTVDRTLETILVGIISILVLDVLWQVASRYLLSDPSKFTDELAGFLLIWVGLLGAAWVTGMKQHLSIDLILQKLAETNKKRLQLFINFLVLLFTIAVMIVGGIWLVYTRFHLGQISPALNLPLGYVYAVLPISGIIITYYLIDNSLILINKTEKI